jgi:hypothetical protein
MNEPTTNTPTMEPPLLSYADVCARLGQPVPQDAPGWQRLYRKLTAWKLKPIKGTRGKEARFRPASLAMALERADRSRKGDR